LKNLLTIGYLNSKHKRFKPHIHDCWEIVYYYNGNGVATVGDVKFDFFPGKIICFPPGVAHSELSEKGFKNIFFSVSSFEYPRLEIPIFYDNESKHIYQLFMQLYSVFNLQHSNSGPLTESLLNSIYQYFLEFSSENKRNPMVEKLENLLVSNLSNHHLNIKKLMSELPISVDHLRRLFVNDNKMTPSEFLAKKRIDYAKSLLSTHGRNPQMRIKEIAWLSGFEDPYHFSRVFKKHEKKSPKNYFL